MLSQNQIPSALKSLKIKMLIKLEGSYTALNIKNLSCRPTYLISSRVISHILESNALHLMLFYLKCFP